MSSEPSFARSISADSWITADEVPDPKVLPTIPGWKILVRPVSIKTKTPGGIILPPTFHEDVRYLTTVGRVVVVGDAAYSDKKYNGKPWCKVGDYVTYGKLEGKKLVYKGVQMILMYEDDIDMVVANPTDIDTSKTLTPQVE